MAPPCPSAVAALERDEVRPGKVLRARFPLGEAA
ncbi:hypothetical protein FHX45_003802 [Amycolatopsis granulosa]|nr:hypothetical protein [Amycolatopsis granulosa]